MKYLYLFILLIPNLLNASSFDRCNDVVVDEVTDIAYGEQGLLFSGEKICYYDGDNTKIKYIRIFEKGVPIGEHICYAIDGRRLWSFKYANGVRDMYGACSWIVEKGETEAKWKCWERNYNKGSHMESNDFINDCPTYDNGFRHNFVN